MKTLTVIFVTLLVMLQYRLWIGDGSLSDVLRISDAAAAQLEENQRLQTRNHALEAEVKDLKTGNAAIEERARSELGMIGRDETFFQVIDTGSTRHVRHSPARKNGLKKTAYRCDDEDKCILPGFGR